MSEDLLGLALWDYVNGDPHDLISWTNISPPEIFRTAYMFRDYAQMPYHERVALKEAKGKILDVGAGAGSHVLALQAMGKDAEALERSYRSVQTMRLRNVKRVIHGDFFLMQPLRQYDTLLFLLNGAGMAGEMARMPLFFEQIRLFLRPGGKAIVHMSPVDYVYEMFRLPKPHDRYYGEVKFYIKYRNMCQEPFPWIYFDPDTFSALAKDSGFDSRMLADEEETGDYLLEIRPL